MTVFMDGAKWIYKGDATFSFDQLGEAMPNLMKKYVRRYGTDKLLKVKKL